MKSSSFAVPCAIISIYFFCIINDYGWHLQSGKLLWGFGVLGVSPSLVDLLKRIFKDEASRIKIRDIQTHPWMTNPIPSKKLNINF